MRALKLWECLTVVVIVLISGAVFLSPLRACACGGEHTKRRAYWSEATMRHLKSIEAFDALSVERGKP